MAAAAGAALGMRWNPLDTFSAPTSVLGWSQGGLPLVVHHYGTGGAPYRLFVMGAHHGGPEANTQELTRGLMAHFDANLWEIPSNVALDFVPEANPDGLASGSRQFLSGVDPNRNWNVPGWQPDAYDSNGRFRYGLGGSEPMSEPETKALADYLYWTRPVYVINYHSQGGFMFGGGDGIQEEIAWLYSVHSGFRRPGGGGAPGSGGGGSVLGYRVTGAMNGWLRGQGIGSSLIELSTTWDPEIDRNLAGLRAVLERLGRA